ncbi:MAG: hypothetical protein AB7U75_12165 [Hyphomicrobiaceae bacterium]
MSSTEMRELTQTDLELISGGVIEGYKWCWDGPAGDGAYPNYVDCGPTWGDIFNGWAQRGRDLAALSKKVSPA